MLIKKPCVFKWNAWKTELNKKKFDYLDRIYQCSQPTCWSTALDEQQGLQLRLKINTNWWTHDQNVKFHLCLPISMRAFCEGFDSTKAPSCLRRSPMWKSGVSLPRISYGFELPGGAVETDPAENVRKLTTSIW